MVSVGTKVRVLSTESLHFRLYTVSTVYYTRDVKENAKNENKEIDSYRSRFFKTKD